LDSRLPAATVEDSRIKNEEKTYFDPKTEQIVDEAPESSPRCVPGAGQQHPLCMLI
jgi:hypothetical protein